MKEEIVYPEQGVLDLAAMDDQTMFHVQGQIAFFPGEFLTPQYYSAAEFEQMIADKKPQWVGLSLSTAPNPQKDIPSTFGTFVVRVLNSQSRNLSIQFPRLYHHMEVYLAQKGLAQRAIIVDQIDQDPLKNRNTNPFITSVPLISIQGDFYLIAHVSSPKQDGLSTINISSFYLAHEGVLSRTLYYSRLISSAVVGSFFIVFIFYCFIYCFRIRDLSSLYLSLYSLFCFGLSSFFVVEYTWKPADVMHRFSILNAFAITFLQLFLVEKIQAWISKALRRRLSLFFFSLPILVAVFLHLLLFEVVALLFIISLLASLAIMVATIVLGLRHGMNGLGFFLAGTFINMALQVPILANFMRGSVADNGYSIILANFFMVICLALLNAKEFAAVFKKSINQGRLLEHKNQEITFFNRNLEKLVSAKTKEIRSLLDFIPQGVLSIGSQGLVSKDYSAHLSKIIGTEDIAERSFKDLVLNQCSLSEDLKDQTWQTLQACIGEDPINFEMNSQKLPSELLLFGGVARKYLQVTWNIEIENHSISQVLVTLLDITNQKALEEESAKNRKDMQVIEELINVSPMKAAQFFLTITPLLEENLRLLSLEGADLDVGLVRSLFLNAHTVKGAARTLQFKELASSIHQMEDMYATILRDEGAVDLEELKAQNQKCLAVLQHYREINRTKLGRSDDFQKIPIEREFIEKHYSILKNIIKSSVSDSKEIIAVLKEQSEALTQVIFEDLPSIFEGYREKSFKIARDVGKHRPFLDFEVEPVWVAPEIRMVLDNCMIHILRNALDHGIESSEERLRSGKPEAGRISFVARLDQKKLNIEIQDDGKGLAMERLREKGLKRGLLNGPCTPQEIAEIIFAPGLSTQDQVSILSGRGMGMDAVRVFLKQIDGHIRINLGQPHDPVGEFYPFKLEIVIPLEA